MKHTLDTSKLTEREEEVLELARGGRSNGDIAARLHIAVRTVKFHLSNIYRDIGVPLVGGQEQRKWLLRNYGIPD